MILINDKDFIELQKKGLPLVEKLFSNRGPVVVNDFKSIADYISKILKYSLVGRLSYIRIPEFLNRILYKRENLAFFTREHSKKEIREFVS